MIEPGFIVNFAQGLVIACGIGGVAVLASKLSGHPAHHLPRHSHKPGDWQWPERQIGPEGRKRLP